MKIFEIIKFCPHFIIFFLLEPNWTTRRQASQESSSWQQHPGYHKARYLFDEVASSASRDWYTKQPEELV